MDPPDVSSGPPGAATRVEEAGERQLARDAEAVVAPSRSPRSGVDVGTSGTQPRRAVTGSRSPPV